MEKQMSTLEVDELVQLVDNANIALKRAKEIRDNITQTYEAAQVAYLQADRELMRLEALLLKAIRNKGSVTNNGS